MKLLILLLSLVFSALMACNTTQNQKAVTEKSTIEKDTIRISNADLEYDVLIFDSGFNSWLTSYAKPRGYYSQSYLESRNRVWILEWNARATVPTSNKNLFEMRIDYNNTTDYGYEVNYLLYNYLVYFQLKNNIKLGGFSPRL